ncbi:alpha/beta hydrolase [Methylomonas sp. LW13]|uniref:alpha/beta fold hydrolase n=1 Tax=unclassified Methylomonas TaxID=2608980 RepID=UPI000A04AA4F|nr:alpha/beta hydrolase [Methylomonas sp. Kb3]PKD40615.1 alpha/beta hydrolase [Methylomonas sp. Kb3]QBC27680.1 alpha/beta hydrolase [Methylomonas sp. LW13]
MKLVWSRRFRFLCFGLAITCFAALSGAVYQAERTVADLAAFPPPGRMISVNGVKLHLYRIGSGSPTLVLEAGLGENVLSWHPVQAKLAQTMRVCAYDRPGLGWSDPVDTAIHPEDVAKNLHTLLNDAGITPPFVLVGHSRGGIYVRAFYHQFPEDTQGIVLVDSTHEQSPMHQYPYASWDYRKQAIQIAVAEPLSRIGLVRLLGIADADRKPSPLPAAILAAKTAVQNRTDTAHAVVNEIAVMRRGLDPATPPPGSLGNLVLLVLTAGNLVDLDYVAREAERSGKDVEAEKALAKIQQAEQDELVHLSSHSRLIIVSNSGHFIMQDQADEFVGAVSEFAKPLAQK